MYNNIFASLFNYRPRPNRRPLEDFITEALAHLLNEDHQLAIAYLGIFLQSENTRTINQIRTQQPTSTGKRIDLVISWRENDRAWSLAVENKTWTSPWVDYDTSGEVYTSQIYEYCQYQASQDMGGKCARNFTALVSPYLIDGFDKVGVSPPNYLGNKTWRDVCQVLTKCHNSSNNKYSKKLAESLVAFIREKDMSGFDGFTVEQMASIRPHRQYHRNLMHLATSIKDRYEPILQRNNFRLKSFFGRGEKTAAYSWGIGLYDDQDYGKRSPLWIFFGVATQELADLEWYPPLLNNEESIPDVVCCVKFSFDSTKAREEFLDNHGPQSHDNDITDGFMEYFSDEPCTFTYYRRRTLTSFVVSDDQISEIFRFIDDGITLIVSDDNPSPLYKMIMDYTS